MKKALATSYAAVTVLNALMCWKGAAFPANLKLTATAVESEEPGIRAPSRVVELAAQRALRDAGAAPDAGVEVEVESEIPRGMGLGSSSAAATAAYRAVYKLIKGSEPPPEQAARAAAKACIAAGVSATGAFDDAMASITPGYIVVTDNWEMKVEKKIPLPKDLKLKIWVPPGLTRPDNPYEKLRRYAQAAIKIYELLLDGKPWEAMTLNGVIVALALGYPLNPILDELRRGALAAAITGNGPAYAAVGYDYEVPVVI